MKTAKKLLLALLIGLSGLSFEACKTQNDPTVYTYDYRDTLYATLQNLYFWYDRLPTLNDFKPQSYPTTDPSQLIAKIRTYSPLNSQGQNVDRWSFIMTRAEYDAQQKGEKSGLFGFSRGFMNDTDLRVAYVLPNSPFDKAGVTRGWKILKINGIDATAANVTQLNNELGNSTVSFRFQDLTGTQKDISISRDSFTTNAVQYKSILKVDGKNVGYIVLSEFTDQAKTDLTNAFNYFQQNGGIQELVIDLRYNGGGDPNVATQFANYFVPSAANGKVFFTYQYNDKNPQRNATIRFDKGSSTLALNRVFFITTQGSASASELLINGVKPFMQTILVGDRTHGKPVGMLGFLVDKYIPFAISFKIVNANGEGDYFEGIPVQKQQTDDLTRNFGDPKEACLSDVLYFIKNGTMPAQMGARLSSSVVEANDKLSQEPMLKDLLVIQH
ncbi:MAG: S41 family peptidase [Spirosomataceae bacterium]